ncbi:MAG: 1-(5-phosphoribosyl)-5-[(5-phosphoribosylamino)methylideneamino]imidazole-4-carboxamide isomerase [Oscillospiraceae bacterium]|nr:1-(5-phosphoribosyl)-5-[(5-phosphoribosylamino)methylideneamino]imidazole-4-carboxamide isomerase [Oscillospiraceae bacterium]
MILYPAIDIYEGKAVRLLRGDYAQMTVYSGDPISVAQGFKNQGATALHIVDLEAARLGEPANFDLIANIAARTKMFVQVGGGIRTLDSVEMYLDAGVSRVIIGTAAISKPGFLREIAAKYKKAIAVSADIKDGRIAIKGWTEVSDQDTLDFCKTALDIGIKTVICTDISKDGMQGGSNIELYKALRRELSVDIIASGGVSSVSEIKTLTELGINGAILGKALYEGILSIEDALCAAR